MSIIFALPSPVHEAIICIPHTQEDFLTLMYKAMDSILHR